MTDKPRWASKRERLALREATHRTADQRSCWYLTRDERRVLLITFLGGLGSIVAGACAIGAALGFDGGEVLHVVAQDAAQVLDEPANSAAKCSAPRV